MKVYWRDDLEEQGEYPACSELLSHEEWAYLDFEVIDNPCENFETEEGFNMIIKHPQTHRYLFVCSKDFNYCEEWA